MKKIIPLLFICMLFFSCSGPGGDELKDNNITGKVFVIGNVPFTKLGLQVDKDKIYILDCTEELKDKLLKEQGRDVKIHFSKTGQTQEGTSLKVTAYEIISY
jgi:hypothetical protein